MSLLLGAPDLKIKFDKVINKPKRKPSEDDS
jgi:hypothetical protein